jgi:hypothetical protein
MQGVGGGKALDRVRAQHDIPRALAHRFLKVVTIFDHAVIDTEPMSAQLEANARDIAVRVLDEEHTEAGRGGRLRH